MGYTSLNFTGDAKNTNL